MSETKVLPSEALFGFMGWLTSRGAVSGPFSASHDASSAAELVAEFVKSQGWEMPRDEFPKMLAEYPASPEPLTTDAPTPRETGAEIVAWCPRDKNGAYYVEHAEIVREGVEDDVRILNQMQPDFAPYTVATLYAHPAPASASVTEAVAISERGEPYPTDVESLMRIEWDAKELRKVGGMRHDVARLFAHYTVNEASEPVSAELLNLARAYLFALAAAPGTGASVVDIAPSADLPKLGQPAEAPGWRGDATVTAFRERLELRIRETVDQVARVAGHAPGAKVNLKGFDSFLDCLCDAAAGAALAAAPRDAGREEAERDRIDAERWRAIRSHLRIMGGESHPFVEFLEPNGFIDEEDFVDDNGVAITPEPTFEQLLDRYRAARRGATG
jgi:hypothetical protein